MIQLNVKNLLKKQNKSKYWLFNQLNDLGTISYSNFNNMVENKTKSIKYENISKLCAIFNCKIQDLFVEVNEDTKNK